MVIAVASHVEYEKIGDRIRRIPAVLAGQGKVTSVRSCSADKTVVRDVIEKLEHYDRYRPLRKLEKRAAPAKER